MAIAILSKVRATDKAIEDHQAPNYKGAIGVVVDTAGDHFAVYWKKLGCTSFWSINELIEVRL